LPGGVDDGVHPAPQGDGRGPVGSFVGIAVFVVKAAVLQRHGHNIGQGVIQRFTTRHATISATSASGSGAAAANSATFQVNWASRGRRAALGCTRTSCNTMPLPPRVAAHSTG